ncbi:hypothetical protein GCM10009753_24800 [Streptantibioticus ferralitis]
MTQDAAGRRNYIYARSIPPVPGSNRSLVPSGHEQSVHLVGGDPVGFLVLMADHGFPLRYGAVVDGDQDPSSGDGLVDPYSAVDERVGLDRFVAARELRIEVSDGNPSPARPRPTGITDESGRGLLLVDALAQDWGQPRWQDDMVLPPDLRAGP